MKIILKQLLSVILSLGLFAGGIFILSLRLAGWSLLLGLPAILLGGVFIIFTLDTVARELFTPPHFIMAKCQVCGKTTFIKEGEKTGLCGRCREELVEEVLQEEKKT